MAAGNKIPKIRDFIQAGYPALFLPTVEPEVAVRRVKDALTQLGMDGVEFVDWKITTGLKIGRADMKPDQFSKRDLDLTDALAYVEESERPVVAVFHNLRQFLSNYNVIQQMVDTILKARLRGSHVVIVGPHCEFPPELKSMVTWCDCPLPTREQLAEEFTKIADAYSDEITLPSDAEEREDLILKAATAAVGLDAMSAENAFALTLSLKERIDIQVIQAQKEQEVKRSDVLEFVRVRDDMNHLGGFKRFKDWLTRRRRVFTPEAQEYGLSYPKGVLLVGPAGSGKSLAAQVMAVFLGLPALRLDMGKIFRSLVGESEAAIRLALQVAEAVSPCLLWLDEIDKGLAGMKGSGELDSGVTARVVSTILTWRQETEAPVMMAATANDVAALPSMVYRKGRFDEVWATDLPRESIREEIFDIHLAKRGRDPKKFGTAALAAMTKDFVGAEIESCIEDAMCSAFDEEKEVAAGHIQRSIRETVAQATRDREEVEAIRDWCSTRARMVDDDPTPTKKAKVRAIRKNPKTTKE